MSTIVIDANTVIPAVPTTQVEAVEFIRWCETVIGGGFHPDTRGSDYITGSVSDYAALFTEEQAQRLDAGIKACFDLLPDVYATSNNIYDDLVQRAAVDHRQVTIGRPTIAQLKALEAAVSEAAKALYTVQRLWSQFDLPSDAWTPETSYPFGLSLDEQAFAVQGWADGIAEEIDIAEGRA